MSYIVILMSFTAIFPSIGDGLSKRRRMRHPTIRDLGPYSDTNSVVSSVYLHKPISWFCLFGFLSDRELLFKVTSQLKFKICGICTVSGQGRREPTTGPRTNWWTRAPRPSWLSRWCHTKVYLLIAINERIASEFLARNRACMLPADGRCSL
jgi:hypothetical protein